MDDYLYNLGEQIDDGSNFRIAEILLRLENHDFEEAYKLIRDESSDDDEPMLH
jgi:hypothetical protein